MAPKAQKLADKPTMVLWGQEEDRRELKDAGFKAHLVKPVDYGALMKLLALPSEQGG